MSATILTTAEVRDRIEAMRGRVRELHVVRLALFGSTARGEAATDSDVDLLVDFEPGEKSYDRFLDLSELLESALEHPVDLVTAESLSPFLRPRILSEARDVLRLG